MTSTPIVFLSDFGDSHYAGQMRGAAAAVAPGAGLVDLTHAVSPQNVAEGACILDESLDAFPAGSVFVCVVDPGVGTARRGVAIACAGKFLVGPDNGLFALAARRGVAEAVVLTNPAYFRRSVAPTFHGRDVFAPVAAHISLGVPLSALGPPAGTLAPLRIPAPVVTAGRIDGHVLYADRFGNLVTDVGAAMVAAGAWAVVFRGHRIGGLRRTYADVAPGQALALAGSSGRIEIAIRDGSAAEWFRVRDPARERVRFIRKAKKD